MEATTTMFQEKGEIREIVNETGADDYSRGLPLQ